MLDLMTLFILFIAGIFAGVMNTVGGGGSVLTLPVMILAGIPGPIANATNRIGVVVQNLVGLWQMRKGGVEEDSLAWPLTIAGCLGSGIGVLLAAKIPAREFELILAVLMLVLLVLVLLRPKPALVKPGDKVDLWAALSSDRKMVTLGVFFLLGIYGGFLQAGMGIMILLALGYVMRLDMVRGNYVKLFFILIVQALSLLLFIFSGIEIVWIAGIALFLGQSIGAYLGAWIVLNMGDKWIVRVLIVSILVSSTKLLQRYFFPDLLP